MTLRSLGLIRFFLAWQPQEGKATPTAKHHVSHVKTFCTLTRCVHVCGQTKCGEGKPSVPIRHARASDATGNQAGVGRGSGGVEFDPHEGGGSCYELGRAHPTDGHHAIGSGAMSE